MADEKKAPEDVMALGPVLPNGDIPFVRHREDHTLEAGTARVIRDGEAISPEIELVHLEPIEGRPTYKVTQLHEGKRGPSKVNSEAFRSGWDAVFGGDKKKHLN